MKSRLAASRRLLVKETFGYGGIDFLLGKTSRFMGGIGVTGLSGGERLAYPGLQFAPNRLVALAVDFVLTISFDLGSNVGHEKVPEEMPDGVGDGGTVAGGRQGYNAAPFPGVR